MNDTAGNKLPVCVISRLRMDTDGEGVTTLVITSGCPLRCKYCINPYTWNGEAKKIRSYSSSELFEALRVDNLYFLSTGGGIVFGGGEPLLHSEFLKEFITEYRHLGWKFSVETSLNVPFENLERIYELFDGFIVDTKDCNKERYEAYTSGNYDRFYNNLSFLINHVSPQKITVRVPRIYDFHTGDEAAENAAFLRRMGFINIDIFSYVDPKTRN